MSKKLAAKASLVQLPPALSAGEAPAEERSEAAEVRPKTAPGSMAMFMASQSAAVKEVEELKDRLRGFDGAKPVRMLDPQTVRPSRWANRHEHSFGDDAFAELKADIATAGTNVQPVTVRPVRGVLNGSTAGGPAAGGQIQYELVYGHRRHRACLELGLPLQAMVDEMTDQALFEAMDRENRARKNLSPWEQGMMYRRALEEGLYPSQRRLAESLGVDVALVSKSLSLARLPQAVVAAFASPLDIQYRWAQPLAEALQKDPEGVLARASSLKRATTEGMVAQQVFAALIAGPGVQVLNRSTPRTEVIEGAAGRRAVLSRDARDALTIRFRPGALSHDEQTRLREFISELLAG